MAPRPLENRMIQLSSHSRSVLLRRIDARLGQTVAGRIESEDILQQAFVSAIPHYRRRPVRDSYGFVRWMLQFALNEIRNVSRRRRGEDSGLDWEVPAGASDWERPLPRNTIGPPQQERVLALRDRLFLPWTTVSFVLARPNASSTRKLLGRARRCLNGRLSELQRRAHGSEE